MVLNIELLRWMWLLGWISEHIWKYKIWIVEMCLNIVVTLIDEKMRESCLRCFGYIQRSLKWYVNKKSNWEYDFE